MGRGRTIGTTAAWLVLLAVLVAACGGGEASPSPSVAPEPTAAPTDALATEAPSAEPATAPPAEVVRLIARCEGVAIRTEPATTAEVVVRVPKLTKVRVAETLEGEAYTAPACGTSGSEWIKIDRINGRSVRKLYGVRFGYAAAGFFE